MSGPYLLIDEVLSIITALYIMRMRALKVLSYDRLTTTVTG